MTYYKRGHVSCPSDTRPLIKHNQEIMSNKYNIRYTDYFFKFETSQFCLTYLLDLRFLMYCIFEILMIY